MAYLLIELLGTVTRSSRNEKMLNHCKCQYNFVQKVENNFVQFQFFSGWFSRNARLSFSLYDGPFMEITDE